MKPDALQKIKTQVMWNRLISVVEEQAQTLLRTAFGSVAREAGDLSAGVYDTKGRMLAQAVTGTPGHVNTMAMAVAHFLDRFPLSTLKPGDVLITNDPWYGTGHLFDYVVVTPAFYNGKAVALLASTCHVIDVGGVGFSADARSVYEEGTLIPHLKVRQQNYASKAELNEDLLAIITANSRNPVEVRGDLMSLISCNDTGVKRLLDMLAEFELSSLQDLAEHIIAQSRAGVVAAIEQIPTGVYEYCLPLDGYENPIDIKTKLTLANGEIELDFSGSSPASVYGINSPRCYTHAYAVFGLKAVIAPGVPNNAGSLDVFKLKTEAGTCVDPQRPSPVTARHVIGQMLPDAVFGCLAQAVPERVPAESAGSIWVLAMSSAHERESAEKLKGTQRFNVMNVALGGVGARPGKDGLSVTAFPSGVGAIPVEITENQCPLVFRCKEYLPDSDGAGEFRGGLGQVIEISNSENAPFMISAATFDRLRNPAAGRAGGEIGGLGRASLSNGKTISDKGLHLVPAGETLKLELPGGGGYGNANSRKPEAIKHDLSLGLVTRAKAKEKYGYTE